MSAVRKAQGTVWGCRAARRRGPLSVVSALTPKAHRVSVGKEGTRSMPQADGTVRAKPRDARVGFPGGTRGDSVLLRQMVQGKNVRDEAQGEINRGQGTWRVGLRSLSPSQGQW